MVEGVLALDQYGKAIFANPAFCAMFDLKMERLQGKTFLEISRNAQLSDFISSLLTGQHEEDQHGGSREITLYVPQGEKIFSVQASKISQETDGEMVLLVFHDITRIKKVEQIRRDFVANVSHELRTPLTALTGSTELLLDGAYRNEEECKKFLEIMDKQLRNIQNLVSDMLKLAAVEDSRIPVTREAVNLRELTEDISKIIEPIARKKNQTLRVVVPPEEVLLHVDSRQFSDALTNLLDNAVKYTDEGGRIELTCRINGGIEVEVRDNGPGIPRDQLSRIFERFYRLDKSRSREMGGTGLGLSITKHIVENHGGSISVESEPGQGTIFTIRLPQSSFVLQHS
jgi:two-component system phosphate regulon sensor histidine kinase PhoR